MAARALPVPKPATDKPTWRRRWIPVSLKLFVVIMAGLGIGGLWIGVPAFRRAMLIRGIQQSGGVVLTYPSQGPTWLQRWLGGERIMWFQDAEFVGLDPSSTDATLGRLEILARLQRLDLRGTQVTDAGLAHLKSFDRLTDLALADTGVTDEGLAHLKAMTNLERLSLGTRVTNAGLRHLAGQRNLRYLRLKGTQVTDLGLRELHGLKLVSVWLNDNLQITEAGIDELKSAIPRLAVGQ
jgi:hypothetical protein